MDAGRAQDIRRPQLANQEVEIHDRVMSRHQMLMGKLSFAVTV
jgi:hypothetical protein